MDKFFITAGVVALFLSVALLAKDRARIIERVATIKEGRALLICDFKDGRRVVDADMVVDWVEGNWIFKNGSATACEIEEVKK